MSITVAPSGHTARLAALGTGAALIASTLMVPAAALGSSASTVVVPVNTIAPFENGDESSVDYNYDTWHMGGAKTLASGIAQFSLDGDALLLHGKGTGTNNAQILKGFPITQRPTDVTAALAGAGWEVAADSASDAHFQVPVFYDFENTQKFTTLRPLDITKGVNTVALDQTWTTSYDIAGTDVKKNDSLALSSLIDALGDDVQVLGFGVVNGSATDTAKIKSITFGGVQYQFGAAASSYSSTVKVQKAAIAPFENGDEASADYNYDTWHVGNTADAAVGRLQFDVVKNELVLKPRGEATKNAQVMTGYPIDGRPSNLVALINAGASWTIAPSSEAGASFQIPVFYTVGGERKFTTLRPATNAVGTNVASLHDTWATSSAIAGSSFAANSTGTLAELITALGDQIEVLGFGVVNDTADKTAIVTELTWDGVRYTFADDKTLTVAPSITGTVAVGQTLTANAATNHPSTFKYQWLRNGKAISKATKQTYKLTSSDLSKRISVKVTASRTGFKSVTKTSSATAKVVRGNFEITGEAAVAGDLNVGKKLSVTLPTVSPKATVKYQWYRNGKAIKDAKKSTYTLTASDLNTVTSVKASFSASGYNSASQTAIAANAVEVGELAVTKQPTIKGTTKVNSTLKASSAGWNASGLTLRYHWWAGDPAADSSTWTLVQSGASKSLKLSWLEKSQTIFVTVTGHKNGYTSATTNPSKATAAIR